MTYGVRLFARLRDLAGASELSVDLPPGSTVGDLRRAVAQRLEALAPLLARSACAVGGEFTGDEAALPEGAAEAAFLPPVSGGSGAAGRRDAE
jgi:molybdopterin converting factor small subunit